MEDDPSIQQSIKFLKITLIIFKIFLFVLVLFIGYVVINIKGLNKNRSTIDNSWNYFQDNTNATPIQKKTETPIIEEKTKQLSDEELKAIYQAQENEIKEAEERARQKYNF